MTLIAHAPNLRRKTCALALPGFPLALLAGTIVSPTDSTKNSDQLRAAAAHGRAWQSAAMLELLAAALLAVAVVGIVHVVRRRGVVLAHVGAVLGGLGALGLALIGARHLFIYALAGDNQATSLDILHRLDTSAGGVTLPLLFAGPIALIALSVATVRAGFAPRWAPAGALAFFLLDMLPIPGAEAIQGLLGLATFGTIAVRMLRLTDQQWETPTLALATPTLPRPQPSAANARA